jgi:hypothetical protein
MNTEGSLEGIRTDYKDLRGEADYKKTRDDLGGYQDKADTLAGEAETKYAGYEGDITKLPDYSSKVKSMGDDMKTTGTNAQTALANLAAGIDTTTTAGKKALTDAATKMGLSANDIATYESNIGGFAKTGAGAATTAAGNIDTATGEARTSMGTAGTKLGGMADKAMDTGALMKDRGLFAGQIEARRKATEKGKLGNLRRSMASAGSSPEEIARAEAEMSSGGQESREDALAASMGAMQSGQSQLAQAAGMTTQEADIAARRGSLGISGGEAAGRMGLAGSSMEIDAAGKMAGMAGQRAAIAGETGAMGLEGAKLGLSGAGLKAGNISAGAGHALAGAAGAAGAYESAQNLGIGKVNAAAGMYGKGLDKTTGLMNMGSALATNQQTSQMNEIDQRAGLTGGMAGMTGAQLQDVVAQQNAAQEKDLAEKGLLAVNRATAANAPQKPSTFDQMMGLANTGIKAYGTYKAVTAMGGGTCIPKGITIDMADGNKVPIEKIEAGDLVIGMDGKEAEVLQAHGYKQAPDAKFVTITFDDGSKVNCSHDHMVNDKRARKYKLNDKIGRHKVTDVIFYSGVTRSYDLLTTTGGYRINGIPVNTMIPELAEKSLAEMYKITKLVA